MAIPQWLAISISVLILGFGGYRLWLAVAGPSNFVRANVRRGMLAMSRRSHGLVAVLYLLVGAALLASAFGWNPWHSGGGAGAPTAPPPAGSALPVR
ncbi:MAG: hypothetical protein IPL61_11090 [Myxococcales bacterium]|nr:hypothetical protein [Myxococcales bacterium]